ncbi:MAG: preprotein translocase subunit SecG [Verrucomicrobiota bacterium]|jgi:preprotein translocase subunit SecG
MQLVINLLSLILVVISLFLGLLILLQLPKKEAGITAAFGAESTAAIFGAGSGTALTTITRWSATLFLSLCFIIAVMTAQQSRSRTGKIKDLLDKPAAAAPVTPGTPAPATPAPSPAPAPAAPKP